MSIFGTAKNAIGKVGQVLIPKQTKKTKQPEHKDFIHETPEEYANRLRDRRSRGY